MGEGLCLSLSYGCSLSLGCRRERVVTKRLLSLSSLLGRMNRNHRSVVVHGLTHLLHLRSPDHGHRVPPQNMRRRLNRLHDRCLFLGNLSRRNILLTRFRRRFTRERSTTSLGAGNGLRSDPLHRQSRGLDRSVTECTHIWRRKGGQRHLTRVKHPLLLVVIGWDLDREIVGHGATAHETLRRHTG